MPGTRWGETKNEKGKTKNAGYTLGRVSGIVIHSIRTRGFALPGVSPRAIIHRAYSPDG